MIFMNEKQKSFSFIFYCVLLVAFIATILVSFVPKNASSDTSPSTPTSDNVSGTTDNTDGSESSGSQSEGDASSGLTLLTDTIIMTTNCIVSLPDDFISSADGQQDTDVSFSITYPTGYDCGLTFSNSTISATSAEEYIITFFLSDDASVSADLTVIVRESNLSDAITQNYTSLEVGSAYDVAVVFDINSEIDDYEIFFDDLQLSISGDTIYSDTTGQTEVNFCYSDGIVSYCYTFTLNVVSTANYYLFSKTTSFSGNICIINYHISTINENESDIQQDISAEISDTSVATIVTVSSPTLRIRFLTAGTVTISIYKEGTFITSFNLTYTA